MKYLMLVPLILSSCATSQYIQVKCSNGFTTPPSFLAYAHGGDVIWRENKNSMVKKKRIASNETCRTVKVNK